MKDNSGVWAMITGAAGGIGYFTAEEFARGGYNLVLNDIDEEGVFGAAERLRKYNIETLPLVYDVSDRLLVEKAVKTVLGECGGIDILINNAGVGVCGELDAMSIESWKRLMDINFWGPLYHIYACLPSMKARGSGKIVNISSGQSFFRLPTWGAYAAIKSALGVFSEILHFELRHYGIHVSTVYPFLTATAFYKDINSDTAFGKLFMNLIPYVSMKPEKVGKIIFKAAQKKRKVELVSVLNRLGYCTQGVTLIKDAISHAGRLFLLDTSKGKGKKSGNEIPVKRTSLREAKEAV